MVMRLKNVHNFKHYFLVGTGLKANGRSVNLIVCNSATSNDTGEIILAALYFRIMAVTEDLTLPLHVGFEVLHLVSSSQVFQLKCCTYFSTRLKGP